MRDFMGFVCGAAYVSVWMLVNSVTEASKVSREAYTFTGLWLLGHAFMFLWLGVYGAILAWTRLTELTEAIGPMLLLGHHR